MEWITVCEASELQESLGVSALIGYRQVAIFKAHGELFAIGNYDPFSHTNVLSRGIVGELQGRAVVASPVYKQHFDLMTGECLEDGTVCLDVYCVREQAGMLQVAYGVQNR